MSLTDLLSSTFGKVVKDVTNQTTGSLNQTLRTSTQKVTQNLTNEVKKSVNKAMLHKEDVVFNELPKNLDELMKIEGSDLKNPYKAAAFVIVALDVLANDKEAGKLMLEYLNGPEELTNVQLQPLEYALKGKEYITKSYFKGTTPDNNYTPTKPYTIHVEEDGNSKNEEGYITLYVTSSGADSPRPIKLRKRGDMWYFWTIRQLTMSIRNPKAGDKWANKPEGEGITDELETSYKTEEFTFNNPPTNVAQLMLLPESMLDTPQKTVALTMLALLVHETNPEVCFDMLDTLNGPNPMNPNTKAFINDRLKNKEYIVKSFFEGATPENGYVPTTPLTIKITSDKYSFVEDNYATLKVKSSGDDEASPMKLRLKPSTNQWFIQDINCLREIRVPVEADPWA